jgi:hypothetical protein
VRKRQSLLYVQALKFIQTKSPSGRKVAGAGGSDAGAASPSERKTPGSGNK